MKRWKRIKLDVDRYQRAALRREAQLLSLSPELRKAFGYIWKSQRTWLERAAAFPIGDIAFDEGEKVEYTGLKEILQAMRGS